MATAAGSDLAVADLRGVAAAGLAAGLHGVGAGGDRATAGARGARRAGPGRGFRCGPSLGAGLRRCSGRGPGPCPGSGLRAPGGSGPLAARYQKLRKNDQISFWGSVSDEELRKAYSGARALVFPTEEDFGIVLLEAQACGAPVIAFRKGGALETVQSGVFFDEQTPEAIRDAVLRIERQTFDPREVSAKVQGFGRKYFLENIKKTIGSYYASRRALP